MHPARNANVFSPLLHRAIALQSVSFVEESVDFLADGGMFGDLAELFELAGFEEEVGFGKEVVVADISESLADEA